MIVYMYFNYEKSRPCSLREELFLNCILKTYCLILWPIYATNRNGQNICREIPNKLFCKVILKFSERLRMRRNDLSVVPYAPEVEIDPIQAVINLH